MDKKNNKIPGAAIAIAVVLVLGIVFIPTVYMPYNNKKPTMDAEHQAALEEIQLYEDSIANQASIEKNIDDLQAEWDDFQKTMFIDASSSLADIEAAVRETDFHITAFVKSEGQADPNGAVSFTGSPLYYQTITITGYSDRDTLLDVLQFIEEDSIGCYYVKSLMASTIEREEDLGAFTLHEGDLQVNMVVYLYYYNQDIHIDPVTDTDTDTNTAS